MHGGKCVLPNDNNWSYMVSLSLGLKVREVKKDIWPQQSGKSDFISSDKTRVIQHARNALWDMKLLYESLCTWLTNDLGMHVRFGVRGWKEVWRVIARLERNLLNCPVKHTLLLFCGFFLSCFADLCSLNFFKYCWYHEYHIEKF